MNRHAAALTIAAATITLAACNQTEPTPEHTPQPPAEHITEIEYIALELCGTERTNNPTPQDPNWDVYFNVYQPDTNNQYLADWTEQPTASQPPTFWECTFTWDGTTYSNITVTQTN